MYEWGSKPNYTDMQEVGSDYAFQHGEFGKILDQVFVERLNAFQLITETDESLTQKFTEAYINEVRNKGANVLYIRSKFERVSITSWGTFTIEECIFSGSPFIVSQVVQIAIVLAATAIILAIYYQPAVYKLLGITPIASLLYNIASLFNPIIILIFIALVLYFGFGSD